MTKFMQELAIIALEHGFIVHWRDWDNKLEVSDDDGSIVTDDLRELRKWMGYY